MHTLGLWRGRRAWFACGGVIALAAIAAAALVVSGSPAARASATLASDQVYPSGGSGYDVSWPQCSGSGTVTLPGLSSATGFGIVGVTDGRAFTTNACLQAEASWATPSSSTSSAAVNPTFYMNLNAPVGSTASNGYSGPAGNCKKSNTNCVAYNYGYNAAQYALSAAGVSSAMWWLDIETGNSWSKTKTANDYTIEGAVDAVEQSGAKIGVYSTASMYNTIAGSSFQPGTLAVPGQAQVASNITPVTANWVAGQTGGCSTSTRILFFPNATEWLVQVASSPFDQDAVCY